MLSSLLLILSRTWNDVLVFGILTVWYLAQEHGTASACIECFLHILLFFLILSWTWVLFGREIIELPILWFKYFPIKVIGCEINNPRVSFDLSILRVILSRPWSVLASPCVCQ